MAATTLQQYGFTSDFVKALKAAGGASAEQALLNAIANSALLQSMFAAFSTVSVGHPQGIVTLVDGKGTDSIYNNPTHQATIYFGRDMLTKLLSFKNPPGILLLADVLAHELGHMTMPSGHPGTDVILNPLQAYVQGFNNEGTAVAAQYVVAKQLGLTEISGDSHQQMTKLLDNYSTSAGAKPTSITTLAQLQNPQWFLGWQGLGGALYSTLPPSTSTLIDYSANWIDQWLLSTPEVGLAGFQVDWTKVEKHRSPIRAIRSMAGTSPVPTSSSSKNPIRFRAPSNTIPSTARRSASPARRRPPTSSPSKRKPGPSAGWRR
jgi:hypothetical protein